MLQEQLARVGVELLLGEEVVEHDVADRPARGGFVLDLGDLPRRQALHPRGRHTIGNRCVARHTPLTLHAADFGCPGTGPFAAGRSTVTRVPSVGALSTSTAPPCASTSAFTTASPMPVPRATPAASGTR